MNKRYLLLSLLIILATVVPAQRPAYTKMSSWLRHACNDTSSVRKIKGKKNTRPSVCAFVRLSAPQPQLLQAYGCTPLAQFGNLFIADIPLHQLSSLSRHPQITTIEAGPSRQLLLDTARTIVQVPPIQGAASTLPQAYTGKGVVMGIQDVGFDLTHPNFYDTACHESRIRRFWDQLSTDTLGSNLLVGADYTTPATIATYAHSRDASIIQHGNHTAGIAAGTGYDTPYRGVAYESDLCLVSNAVVNDTVFIRQDDLYKYTSATDVLGFKYIFDYAEEQNQPCVISFSEGEREDLDGECRLLYEALDSLVGPGRILVASAGNDGGHNTFFLKESDEEQKGAFLLRYGMNDYFRVRTRDHVNMRLVVYDYGGGRDTLLLSTTDILSQQDSLLTDTLQLCGVTMTFEVCAYPSSYDNQLIIYDFYITSSERFGYNHPVSFEIIGKGATAEFLLDKGDLITNNLNPALNAGEPIHSVYSPSTAPRVISVGATAYRTSYVNAAGTTIRNNWGSQGERAHYSGIGPTLDGRVKPDVVAPGTNILSSMSSYYLEEHPDETNATVAYSDFHGRRYPWAAETGTSMSAPLVGGIIACWLQARPDLTPEDIIDLFSKTCKRQDDVSYPDKEYGYGEIDAYKGLLQILGLSGIPTISTSQPTGVTFRLHNRQLSVIFEESTSAEVHLGLYNLHGECLQLLTIPQGITVYTLPLPLPAGVYVIQLNNGNPALHGSTLIRL